MNPGDHTLEDEVRQWLEQSGYPLEMRVAAACKSAGATPVTLSRRYVDPTTGTIRETDVVASWGAWNDQASAFIYLIIECQDHTAPWVVLGSDPSDLVAPQALLDLMFCEEFANPGSPWLPVAIASAYLAHGDTIFDSASMGHSIVTKRSAGQTNQQDPAYAAVMSAYSAVEGFLGDVKRDELANQGQHISMAVLPVVVTNGLLFTARLDNAGEVMVSQTQTAQIAMRQGVHPVVHRCVIVTESGLPDLLARIRNSVRLILPPRG